MDYCLQNSITGNVTDTISNHQKGLWKDYLNGVYRNIPLDFKGATIVDFGCKYGDVFPLYRLLGAERVIGVEVESDYIETGRNIFCRMYENMEILRSESGFIPLQPEIADIVIMNEVISHINPMFLHNVFSEAARILKPDGIFFISDGNNLNQPGYFENVLVPFYEKWENGPDGVKTDRDTVDKCFLTQRREIVRTLRPGLTGEEIDFIAKNTSGLFGEFLINEIKTYPGAGGFVRRPYRRGICPTNPGNSGAVIEKGYYPLEIKRTLAGYGFECPKNSVRNNGANFQLFGIKKHG